MEIYTSTKRKASRFSGNLIDEWKNVNFNEAFTKYVYEKKEG